MANESAYSILGEFQDESLKDIQSGGFVEYKSIDSVDPVNVAIAEQDVQNEDYFDLMSDGL